LIDVGLDDEFLQNHLLIDEFAAVCKEYEQKLEVRKREGYDHSYFFIST